MSSGTYWRGAVEPNVFIKLTKILKDLSVWWSRSTDTEVIELQEKSKSKKGKLSRPASHTRSSNYLKIGLSS